MTKPFGDGAGAFCGGLADWQMPGWREKNKKESPEARSDARSYWKGKIKKEKKAMEDSISRVALRYRLGSLPKIPGVSARRLLEIVEAAKEEVVLSLTDSYGGHGEHGEEWGSTWKATQVGGQVHYRSGAVRYRVTAATLVSAENSASIEIWPNYGRRIKPEQETAIAHAVAAALKGTWPAKAWFGWIEDYSDVDKVGDEFESTGDARPFYRAGVEGAIKSIRGVHGGEYPVKVRVSRVSIRKDGSLRLAVALST